MAWSYTDMCQNILSFNRFRNDKLDIIENTSLLENLIEISSEYPVAIISSCGPSKSGNSFFSNLIYKALLRKCNPETANRLVDWSDHSTPLTGFPWSSGKSRTTKGIWITKEPVLIPHDNQTIAVYIMDIGGIFDMEYLSDEESEIILCFTLLFSTNLLFTMQHEISEHRMHNLAKTLNKLQGLFPQLKRTNIHFIVKDWLPIKDVGFEAGNKYLLQRMTISDEHSKEYKFTRKVLNELFGQKLFCTLFPKPIDSAFDSANFVGSLDQLNGNYLAVLEDFLLSNRGFNFNHLFVDRNELEDRLNSFRTFFLSMNRKPNPRLIMDFIEEYKQNMISRNEREIPTLESFDENHHLCLDQIKNKIFEELKLNTLSKDDKKEILTEINKIYEKAKDNLNQVLDEQERELKLLAEEILQHCQQEHIKHLNVNHDRVFEQQMNSSNESTMLKFKEEAEKTIYNPEIIERITLWLKMELQEHTSKIARQRQLHSQNVQSNDQNQAQLVQLNINHALPHTLSKPEEFTGSLSTSVTPKPRPRLGTNSSAVIKVEQNESSLNRNDETLKESLLLAYETKLRNWDAVQDPTNFHDEIKEKSDSILRDLNGSSKFIRESTEIFEKVLNEKMVELNSKLCRDAEMQDEIELSQTMVLRSNIQQKVWSNESEVNFRVSRLIESAIQEFQSKSEFQTCVSYMSRTLDLFEKKLRNVFSQIAQQEQKNMVLSELEKANLLHEVTSWYRIQMDKLFAREDYIKPDTLNDLHSKNIQTAKEKFGQNIPSKNTSIDSALSKLFIEYKEKNQMNKPGNVAIGIDLGTTYCCVGLYRRGKVEIIADRYGSTIPSYVALLGSGELVGQEAKERAHISPEETIFDAKRLIGRKFDDPQVQNDIKLWPFKVTSQDNIPQIQVNGLTYEPEKISAKLLHYIKEIAQTHLKGHEVVNAVITVPAAFGDGQRQATRDAATIAGLNVLRIINEPTAAALAYNVQRFTVKNGGKKNVLVYDLGGGTFDVSILEVQNGKLEVRATDGDTHLGGEDFDGALVNHCVNEFYKTTGVMLTSTNGPNALSKPQISKILRRIRNVCEGAKRALSELPEVPIDIAHIASGMDLKLTITRQQFESMNMSKFQNTIKTVEDTLRKAGLTKNQIDDVVLVGGSTKIPKVRQLLENYFGKKPVSNINADEAVAYGAAIQAAIINGQISDLNLQDVSSSSLGIELKGGTMSFLIKKNQKLPAIAEGSNYVPAHRGQSSVTIVVYQGENQIANNNEKLGSFELTNLPTKYVPNITVRMEMDLEGIIHVTASCEGKEADIRINLREGKGRMSEQAIQSARDEFQESRSTKP